MEKKRKIDRIVEAFRNHIQLKEDGVVGGGAPTNNISSGNIAKYDPLMQPPIMKRYAKGGRGSRRNWLNYLKNK